MAKLPKASLLKNASSIYRNVFVKASVTTAADARVDSVSKSIDEIPGFRSFPFVGTSWVFYPVIGKYDNKKAHLYDRDKFLKFGDISKDTFNGKPVLTIYNKQDIETITRNESRTPNRGVLHSLLKYRETRKEWFKTTGLILTNGEEWYDLRFKLQRHMMKPRIVDRYIEPITDVTRDLIKRINRIKDEKNEVEDLSKELFRWSLESTTYVGLETRMGCLDSETKNATGQKMIDSVQTAFACMNHMEPILGGSSLLLWKYFPTPTWRKFVKSMDFFSEMAFLNVQKAIQALKTKEIDENTVTLLEAMLSSEDIKPHEVVTMVIDMMFAGIDATSNSMGFMLYCLAKSPEKQEKLYSEIIRFLPTKEDRLTAEKLSEMKYLKLCFKEATRLYPIIRGINRITDRDLILSGYHVPKGTMVQAGLQVCGRMEKYFKNPMDFLPERWENRLTKPSPFVHLPFGFGTRSCIGRRIAELESWILTAEIIRRFRVEYHHEEFEIINRLVNIPDRPLKFTFINRL